jgi:flagellin-like protein
MKKAITPVIAIILLIMLTIAVAATAWYWVNGLQSNLESSSASGIDQVTEMGQVQYSIERLVCNVSEEGNISITMINNGRSDISSTELFVIKVYDLSNVQLGNPIMKSLPETMQISGLEKLQTITFLSSEFPSMVAGSRYKVEVDLNSIKQSDYCDASE